MTTRAIIRYGLEVFGDKTKFRRWLCSITPASQPDMVIQQGWEFVYQQLGRIDYGVYS